MLGHPDTTPRESLSAIDVACRRGLADIVKAVVAHAGFEFDEDSTALVTAARGGHTAVVQYLVRVASGKPHFDVNALGECDRRKCDYSALHLASQQSALTAATLHFPLTSGHGAAMNGCAQMAEHLLSHAHIHANRLSEPWDVDEDPSAPETPLLCAVRCGHLAVARALLAHAGTDPSEDCPPEVFEALLEHPSGRLTCRFFGWLGLAYGPSVVSAHGVAWMHSL